MIANREIGLAYVHAAKCGGSTVREQLRDLMSDDFGGYFFRGQVHPVLGRINANHMPLGLLREYFSDAFATVRSVTSYMICRDPMDRFVSGIAQWFRSERRLEPGKARPELIIETVEEIVSTLPDLSQRHDSKLVCFIPQVDYVFLDGEKIVDCVFALEDIDLFFDELQERFGLKLIRNSVWNPTVTYRVPGSHKALHSIRDRAKRMLPTRVYARTRDIALRVFTQKGAPVLDRLVRGSPAAQAFVAEHYRRDAELHAAARARASASALEPSTR